MNSGASDPMQNAYFAAFYMSLGDALGTLFVAICFGANFGRRILLMALLFVVGALTFSLGRLQNVQIMLAILPVAKAMSQATAVLYTYTPEVFPTSFRVNGLAMCSIVHRFAPVVAPYLAAANEIFMGACDNSLWWFIFMRVCFKPFVSGDSRQRCSRRWNKR